MPASLPSALARPRKCTKCSRCGRFKNKMLTEVRVRHFPSSLLHLASIATFMLCCNFYTTISEALRVYINYPILSLIPSIQQPSSQQAEIAKMPYRESHYHSYRSREITHPSIPSYSYARSQPLFAYLRRPTTHIIIYDHSHGGSNNNNNNTKKESDDAFCRRKDRYYARLADDLAAAKKHKGMVGKLMVSTDGRPSSTSDSWSSWINFKRTIC